MHVVCHCALASDDLHAWVQIIERRNAALATFKLAVPKSKVSGPEYFGLTKSTVCSVQAPSPHVHNEQSALHAYAQGMHVHSTSVLLLATNDCFSIKIYYRQQMQACQLSEQVVQAIEGLQDAQDCALYWAHKASHG